jgi:hypothetical protein
MLEQLSRVLAIQASQGLDTREKQKKGAVKNLSHLPGMEAKSDLDRVLHGSIEWGLHFCVAALDSYDCRMIWTSVVRGMPIERAVEREKEKMAAKNITGSDALNDLDYILLNVSRNLWVAPEGQYTKVPSEAATLKRIPALDQFISDCKNNAPDYNVPVRLQDLVACSMGLDE